MKIIKVCETAIVYEILISSKWRGLYLNTTLDSMFNEYFKTVSKDKYMAKDQVITYFHCSKCDSAGYENKIRVFS